MDQQEEYNQSSMLKRCRRWKIILQKNSFLILLYEKYAFNFT